MGLFGAQIYMPQCGSLDKKIYGDKTSMNTDRINQKETPLHDLGGLGVRACSEAEHSKYVYFSMYYDVARIATEKVMPR